MRIIDLTREIVFPGERGQVENYHVPLPVQGRSFTALCHTMHINGEIGTYIDFPGHIVEYDDGVHAGNCPVEDLFMLDTALIRLDREGLGREVTADELESAGAGVKGDVLIVHALGTRDCTEFGIEDIPYFGPGAIRWIADKRFRIFASDIYEDKTDMKGIFPELFKRGRATVCLPTNLHEIRETYLKSCIIPVRMAGIVQLPCRFFVVEGVG